MPNKYAADSVQLLMRMPESMKKQLYQAVEELNEQNPGAQYSANSVLRALVERFIKEKKL